MNDVERDFYNDVFDSLAKILDQKQALDIREIGEMRGLVKAAQFVNRAEHLCGQLDQFPGTTTNVELETGGDEKSTL